MDHVVTEKSHTNHLDQKGGLLRAMGILGGGGTNSW